MRRCRRRAKCAPAASRRCSATAKHSAACSRIYVTDTRRTQQTAAGLAQRLGLKPVVVDAKTDSRGARAPRAARESRWTARSSSDTATPCRRSSPRLRDTNNVPPMGDEEFDTVYVVTVPTIGKASVLRLKY